MKKVVERERNKGYYRVLHVPIWVWVFFILPGHLTYSLYLHGPDWRHGVWLAAVTAVCAWRGWRGRLPGVEPRPYITHYGVHQPNLGYRVVCYSAAWVALLVPLTLNLIALAIAVAQGRWIIGDLYYWLYYPLVGLIALGTALDFTPRAKRSTIGEGSEKAWFYVAVWAVVPAQVVGWAMWRLGPGLGAQGWSLDVLRLLSVVVTLGIMLALGLAGRLPRTQRYYPPAGQTMVASGGM